MRDLSRTSTATIQPPHKGAGFPPFETATYPSQLFWLTITFSVLFLVLWRIGGPMIADTIALRRSRIDDDLAAGEKAHREATSALAAYQAALSSARSEAHSLAEDMRKNITNEIERAKAEADSAATAALEQAQTQIDSVREAARGHIAKMAADAVPEIVQRLLGDMVTNDDAHKAVRAAQTNSGPVGQSG